MRVSILVLVRNARRPPCIPARSLEQHIILFILNVKFLSFSEEKKRKCFFLDGFFCLKKILRCYCETKLIQNVYHHCVPRKILVENVVSCFCKALFSIAPWYCHIHIYINIA